MRRKKAEGFVAESDKELTVALDVTLNETLVEEGFVREVINKLQTMRKDAGFAVTDRIHVTCRSGEKLERIVEANAAAIAGDVLALSVSFAEPAGYVKEWNINGESAVLGVQKA